jgi:hypothetical protein
MDIIDLNSKYQGDELANAFKRVCIHTWEAQKHIDLTSLAKKLTRHIPDTNTNNKRLKSAATLIALNATQSGRENTYHNPLHTARVAMRTALYSQFSSLSDHDYLKNLCAAFGHDIKHPGRGNPSHAPIQNERIAATQTGNIMQQCGVHYQDVIDVESIIISTSPNGPHEFIKDGADSNSELLQDIPELQNFCNNPLLQRMAAIVIDADLFESAGVDYDTFMNAGRALTTESSNSGENMDFSSAASQEYFVNNIIGERGFLSVAGVYLAGDNFQQIRHRVLTGKSLSPTG